MDKLLIRGGKRLSGEITISGAKNAALPILCAGLLTADDLQLSNIPHLQDVSTILKLMRQMGLRVTEDGDRVTLNGGDITKLEAPYELVKTMRDVYGVTIAGGQSELKGKVFRFAHMGFIEEFDIIAGISCLEKVLKEMGYAFELGTGVKAAEEVFSRK